MARRSQLQTSMAERHYTRTPYNEDPSSPKMLVKNESFAFENGQFKQIEQSRTAWDKDQWFERVEYIDGEGYVWC